jgi:hypothetical protein
MAPRELPRRPNLEHLRNEARDRQRQEGGKLTAAQLAVARSYGFPSWPKLKAHVELWDEWFRPPDETEAPSLVDRFLTLACSVAPKPDEATALLEAHPELLDDVYVRAAAGSVDVELAPPGGPFRWEPLLYASYARLADRSTLPSIRALLAAGADPNAGYLWDGGSVFTAVTGVLGGGEDGQPPHPEWSAAARLLLDAGADPNDLQSVYNRMFGPDDAPYELLFSYGLGRDVRPGSWPARLGARAWPREQALALALHWAAEHDYADRVRLFLANGVDPNGDAHHPATHGWSHVETAQRAGNREIVDLLVAAGAHRVELDPAERFAAACLAGDRAEVEATRSPELVEALGALGLLVHAARIGKLEGVRTMLVLGVDVDASTDATALHWAAYFGHLDIVRLLVGWGADTTIEDDEFHGTPLDWAEHAGNAAVAEYLRFAVTPPS